MIRKYLRYKNFNLFNSALKRLVPHFDTGGDKGVCKNAFNTPQPLFLEGSSKVAAERGIPAGSGWGYDCR